MNLITYQERIKLFFTFRVVYIFIEMCCEHDKNGCFQIVVKMCAFGT